MVDFQELKADQPHPRNYPHKPTDYRHTDKHIRLVMASIAKRYATRYIISLASRSMIINFRNFTRSDHSEKKKKKDKIDPPQKAVSVECRFPLKEIRVLCPLRAATEGPTIIAICTTQPWACTRVASCL